ncbi:MAG: FAD:protein FMN transferase [Lysobacterales bacterium]
MHIAAPAPPADPGNATPLPTLERMRPLLGTFVSIRVEVDAARANRVFAAAFGAIEQVQACLSFHDPQSELSRINRSAAVAAQRVSPLFARVLRASLALARASEGRFDPSIGARLVRWGQLPAPEAAAADEQADWRDLSLVDGQTVRFHKPLWLDFGGIAKGYAVDLAVAALKAQGVRKGLVNAGGDLRVFGAEPQTIHVRHPASPAQTIPLLQLKDGAVATSAGYFSARDGYTALVDTATAAPMGAGESVTVVARRAIWADALTKIVLSGPADIAGLLRRLDAQAVRIDSRGQTTRLG